MGFSPPQPADPPLPCSITSPPSHTSSHLFTPSNSPNSRQSSLPNHHLLLVTFSLYHYCPFFPFLITFHQFFQQNHLLYTRNGSSSFPVFPLSPPRLSSSPSSAVGPASYCFYSSPALGLLAGPGRWFVPFEVKPVRYRTYTLRTLTFFIIQLFQNDLILGGCWIMRK